MRKFYKASYAVIGLGFGDEGKGLTVNSLCQQVNNPLVIRYSGGHQAGHTVTLADGTSHVFSNFGSGTLEGCPTYWSKYCTFDPIGVVKELDILNKKGFSPLLYLDKKSPLTTPYEKEVNRNSFSNRTHGSCGVGVGATYKREEAFHSILVGDIQFPSVLQMKLDLLKSFYKMEENMTDFLAYCEFIRNSTSIVLVDDIPTEFDNIIFESSQGLLLDQNIGFFPHVTPSNTGSKNILEMGYEPHLLLVTRAFQTRHGNGPMTNEHLPHNIQDNPKETNILNRFQGEFRKSLLDLDLLKYGIEKDEYISKTKGKELVVTCLDLVKNEYRYTISGQIVGHNDEISFLKGISEYLSISVVHAVSSPQGVFETYDFSQKNLEK